MAEQVQAEPVAVSNLSVDDVKFIFQEHGRVCFENQALRGEVNRLQQILQSQSNSRAGIVVDAEPVAPAAPAAPEAPSVEPAS